MRPVLVVAVSIVAATLLSPLPSLATDSPARPAIAADQPARPAVPVVLYVLPDCGYCEKARQLLTRHGLAWDEVDIARSAAGNKRFSELGGVGTPLLVVAGETLQGFDAGRIESLLKRHGAIAP